MDEALSFEAAEADEEGDEAADEAGDDPDDEEEDDDDEDDELDVDDDDEDEAESRRPFKASGITRLFGEFSELVGAAAWAPAPSRLFWPFTWPSLLLLLLLLLR